MLKFDKNDNFFIRFLTWISIEMVITQPSSLLNPSLLITDIFSDCCCTSALDSGREKCCFLWGISVVWLGCAPSFALGAVKHRKMKTVVIKTAAITRMCSISIFSFSSPDRAKDEKWLQVYLHYHWGTDRSARTIRVRASNTLERKTL